MSSLRTSVAATTPFLLDCTGSPPRRPAGWGRRCAPGQELDLEPKRKTIHRRPQEKKGLLLGFTFILGFGTVFLVRKTCQVQLKFSCSFAPSCVLC